MILCIYTRQILRISKSCCKFVKYNKEFTRGWVKMKKIVHA